MITIRKKDSLELPLHSTEKDSNDKIYVKVVQNTVNTLIYILLGCILIIDMWFIFNGEPLTQFRLHILFCVLGVSFNFNIKLDQIFWLASDLTNVMDHNIIVNV